MVWIIVKPGNSKLEMLLFL
uniref:Uncharacterized protein n=1 Tax=Rhizophora mucronata TaxID=61149 RepID=A0A2P2QUH6_RHIMU